MAPNDASTSPARAAATAVLMRPADPGFEVLLTVRPRSLRFMGGASVFPGGAVDPADLHPDWERASDLDRIEASRRLGEIGADQGLGWYVCAMREAFEEVGYLDGTGDLAAVERTLDAEAFRESCRSAGVILALNRLVPAGRWVTPAGAPVRFDARFFLALVEADFEPVPDPREVSGCAWLTPAQALSEMSAGARLMAPPTIEMLQRLESFSSIEDAFEGLAARGVGGSGRILSARLSPLVHVVLAPNPGVLTGPGTNTYVVGSQPSAVIDPAVDDEEYLDAVTEAAGRIGSILVTHRHPDHIGGVAALAARSGAPVRAWGSGDAGGVIVDPLVDGEIVEIGGARLRTIYAPGHASDHVCFVLGDSSGLFAGDNILGEGSAVIAPPDGDMKAYLDTLDRLEAEGVDRLFTGHFRPLDEGVEVIRAYKRHRRDREASILACLSDAPASVEDIVERVYTDVSPQLHPIARYSVLAHLEMAEADGRALRLDDHWVASYGD